MVLAVPEEQIIIVSHEFLLESLRDLDEQHGLQADVFLKDEY